MGTIRKIRKNRNKLQHGSFDFAIDRQDLGKLRSLIERILLCRVNDPDRK
jgi:hypothetical protein